MNKRVRGKQGEDRAVDFLQNKGYRILQRNFRYERGEIDIVAEDDKTLVFVEVKVRYSNSFGNPEDAIGISKQNRLRKVAEGYLLKNNIDNKECRFDVVAIDYQNDKTEIRHIEDAF